MSTTYEMASSSTHIFIRGLCARSAGTVTCQLDSGAVVVRGKYFSENEAACVVPPVNKTGRTLLEVSVDEMPAFHFKGNIFLGGLVSVIVVVVVVVVVVVSGGGGDGEVVFVFVVAVSGGGGGGGGDSHVVVVVAVMMMMMLLLLLLLLVVWECCCCRCCCCWWWW